VRQRLEPAHPRHGQVEEDQIGLQAARNVDRAPAVLGLADDVEAVLGQERGERPARQRVVVDDEHARSHGLAALIGRIGSAE
jgi:hypothetical protein